MLPTIVKTSTLLLALVVAGGCASPRDHHRHHSPHDRSARGATDRSFERIVSVAAVKRGWTPQVVSHSEVRCTMANRSGRVVVNVIKRPHGEFSIQRVSSNIPGKSYNLLVNSLRQEIDRLVATR